MPRLRTGWIQEKNGNIYARVSWTDKSGKRWEKSKKCKTRTEANKFIKEKLQEADESGHNLIQAERLSFIQLAEYYDQKYLLEPEYVDGRKVIGMRTHKDRKLMLGMLKDYFGLTRVREITHGDIERFKRDRIRTPVILGRNRKDGREPIRKQRTMATVNRELALLRRVLQIAQKQGWIRVNPFVMGDSLISPADEKKRERIMSRDEEARILTACTDRIAHIRPIIICAVDTGMRAGEMFSLTWGDVDLPGRKISIQAFNTKTMKAREVPISSRLALELEIIYNRNQPPPDELVFGIRDRIKKAWATACRRAGVTDLRIHDLRHTAATRLIQGGLPQMEVARVLGHVSLSTSFRYVNADEQTLTRATDILDRLNAETRHSVN